MHASKSVNRIRPGESNAHVRIMPSFRQLLRCIKVVVPAPTIAVLVNVGRTMLESPLGLQGCSEAYTAGVSGPLGTCLGLRHIVAYWPCRGTACLAASDLCSTDADAKQVTETDVVAGLG